MFCPYSLCLTSYLSTILYPRVNLFCPYSLSLTSYLSTIPYPRVTVFCPFSLSLTSYLSKIESISSKSAEAKQLAWQEIEQTRQPLPLPLSILLLCPYLNTTLSYHIVKAYVLLYLNI